LDTARLLASIFLTTLPKLAYKAAHLTLNNDAAKLIFFHQEYGQRISYDITLAEREVRPDPRPLCCSCPPPDSMAPVGTRFKRVRARAILREFPRIKRRLWGGALWEEGYGARTVGDKVTAAGPPPGHPTASPGEERRRAIDLVCLGFVPKSPAACGGDLLLCAPRACRSSSCPNSCRCQTLVLLHPPRWSAPPDSPDTPPWDVCAAPLFL